MLTIAYKAPLYDAALGVHELIFDFRSDDAARSLERMERFAELTGLGGQALRR